MSLPNIVHPWSFAEPASASDVPLLRAAATANLAPIAAALYAAGFAESAKVLATSTIDPALHAMREEWQQTAALDAALASLVARGSGPLVPSVSARPDGSPRFVLQIPTAERAVDALAREHGDDGVSAELRLFLDEALRRGDRFVDAAPGAGFAALSAATAGDAVSVLVLCEDAAQVAAIEASARWSEASDLVTAREAESLAGVSFAPPVPGASTILHAGGAWAVADLLTGARSALERREIGVVAWRCGRADEVGRDAESLQIAAAVLGVFGFQHFALATGADGVELVPAEAMASNEMIFSIEPTFLARFAA